VFFSSHILGEVEAVCDRVGIMNEGELVTTGSLDDLREELDLAETITLEVDTVPTLHRFERLEGVESVEATESTMTVTCTDPAYKIDVVELAAEHATVTDILSEDTSLEQLFTTYTSDDAEAGERREETQTTTPDTEEVRA
jgi:ABC-2 type transport system ATP-binding protein